MTDKMFELMEKMYIELQDLKKGQEQIKTDISDVKFDIQKLGLEIDGDITPKASALLDGYKQNTERVEAIEEKVDSLRLDIDNLSLKTEYNDDRIIEITQNFKKAR